MRRTNIWLGGALCIFAACTTQDRVLLETTSTVVGSGGGMATSADGLMSLSFNSGALSAQTTVTITIDRSRVDLTHGPAYAIGPAGMALSHPVVMTFFHVTIPASGLAVSEVIAGQLSPPVAGSSTDPSSGTVTVPIQHFGEYAVVQPDSGCDNKACGDPCGVGKFCDMSGQCTSLGSCIIADGGSPDASCKGLSDASYPYWSGSFDGGHGVPITPCEIQEGDPNNTTATAQPLGMGMDQGTEVVVKWTGEVDYFSFDIPPGMQGNMDSYVHQSSGVGDCPTGLSIREELLDSNGAVLADSNQHSPPVLSPCGYVDSRNDPAAWHMAPGRYYIRLSASGAVSTPPQTYRLTVFMIDDSLAWPDPADTGVGVDTPFTPWDSGIPNQADAGSLD
jgi:hypothetical protein